MANTVQLDFRSKGKWYLAEDVDNAISQFVEEQEAHIREQNILKEKLQQLREEAEKLKAEVQERQNNISLPQGNIEKSILHHKKVREELEKERDDLISTIRMLRHLRDTFQATIRKDAQAIASKLDEMESKGILD